MCACVLFFFPSSFRMVQMCPRAHIQHPATILFCRSLFLRSRWKTSEFMTMACAFFATTRPPKVRMWLFHVPPDSEMLHYTISVIPREMQVQWIRQHLQISTTLFLRHQHALVWMPLPVMYMSTKLSNIQRICMHCFHTASACPSVHWISFVLRRN